MPVDNALYDAPGDIWWDERQPLSSLRTSINPARLAYITAALHRHHLEPRGLRALDVGCGGGILAEAVAGLGCEVTGVDPSVPSIETARAHAAGSGLSIRYLVGSGERLPVPDAAFDLVYCCDVLEHVSEVDLVLSEVARVLRPSGVFVYDTINRTPLSNLIMIKLFQEWPMTAWMPRHLHEWRQFIKPSELLASLGRAGFENVDMEGMKPAANPVQLFRLLRMVKRGAITPAEMGARSPMVLSRDKSALYVGHALRAS